MGGCRELLFGVKAGHRAILGRLAALGLTFPAESAGEIAVKLRKMAAERRRPFSDHEFTALVKGWF